MTPPKLHDGPNPRSLVVLMIEHEQPEGLSARKLVMETAKHNVLTAYSPDEGLDLLRRFPKVNLVLVHATVLDHLPLLQQVRESVANVPIVVATPELTRHYEGADFVISSHDPQGLLDLLAQQFHIPRAPADR